jgi:ketosteroid isomerase-like protein
MEKHVMEESLALQVVRAFVAKMNAHTVDGLSTLMTDDHRLVTAEGAVMQGRNMVCQRWTAYFTKVPEYAIICEQVIAEGQTIAIFGKARGSAALDGQMDAVTRWEVPAAWKVVVRGTHVAEWHEYYRPEPAVK